MSNIVPFHASAVTLIGTDEAYSRLRDTAKTRISARLALIESVRALVAKGDAQGLQEACKLVSHRVGGKPAWRRLYNDYFAVDRARQAGLPTWRAIYHGQPELEKAALSRETAEFIWGWMQKNQRSSKQGFRNFVEKFWRAGEAVPGVLQEGQLATWQDWHVWRWPERPVPDECPPELPRGWSYENLMRPIHKPAKAELVAARIGIAAALTHLPSIPGTRAHMRPLEWVTFDDVRFDFRIHVPGLGKPVDLVGLVALDIATGSVLGFGLRPVLLREDGTGEKLKLQDSKELIVSILRKWGWPDYGMTIIHENGTATVGDAFASAVHEATAGLVRFSAASMLSGTVWGGGFADRAGGNSRAKAWLESLFNPMHNRLAHLEGQSGRRYDVAPASDHGRRKELAQLAKVATRLRVEDRAQLRMPYIDLDEARAEISEAFHALNTREDHELEGFEQLLQWRFAEGEPWRIWSKVPPPIGREDDVLTLPRLETPIERFERLADGLRVCKLSSHSVPALLCNQRHVKLERGQIVFQIEKRQCIYGPYTPENIPTLQLIASRYGEGKDVLAYYAASDLSTIYLSDGEGRWIGELRRTLRQARGTDGGAAIATKKVLLNQTIARVNARSPEVAEQREEDIAHNLDVLANAEAVPVIEPIDGAETAAVPAVHARLAAAATATANNKRTAAAEARATAQLAGQASDAFASFAAPIPADGADEEEDDGL